MDERTERLRSLFLDVAGEATVTERQEEPPGSLRRRRPVEARLRPVIERMRGDLGFETAFDLDAYARIVVGHLDGADDLVIADELGLDSNDVFEARMDLHLVADDDWPLDVEPGEFTRRFGDEDARTVADELGSDVTDVERARRVGTARLAARRTNGRYRDQFVEIAADGDLSTRLAADAKRSGLREATEDMENDSPL